MTQKALQNRVLAKIEPFVQTYVATLNGTKAALVAGYSKANASVAAGTMLARPEVQARIAELQKERLASFAIDATEVLQELHRLAMIDPLPVFDENGAVRPLEDMPVDVRRTISSIEVEEIWQGRGDDRVKVGELKKVKFWNKNQALEALGRHLALFRDKLEIVDNRDSAAISGAEKAVVARLLALLDSVERRLVNEEKVVEHEPAGLEKSPETQPDYDDLDEVKSDDGSDLV